MTEHARAPVSTTEIRPWGRYTVLDESAVHKAKHIRVEPGRRLSYQRHRRRSEHWFVVTGPIHVTVGDEERILRAGESIDIPAGAAHRAANPGTHPVIFIEVQTGDYFGEDDITRITDDYERA